MLSFKMIALLLLTFGMWMLQNNFQLTSYNFYSKRHEMELITTIIESLKQIIEEDKKEKQPFFMKISDNFVMSLARKVVQEGKKTFLVSIVGESACGKTTLVNNALKVSLKNDMEGVYTVVRCKDYYKDISKQLEEAGSHENLLKSGFNFEAPEAVSLELMKEHLVDLKRGKTVVSPKHDFLTGASSLYGEVKKPARVILNEGLYVLNHELQDIVDIKVYVFTPLSIIRERWYKRAAYFGITGSAADLQFKAETKTAQEYIRPNLKKADVVLNGLVSADYIEFVTTRIFNAIEATC